MNTTALNTTTNNQQQSTWDSTLEIAKGWPRRLWRVNYTKHVLPSKGWCVDWQVIAPDGLVKAFKNNDSDLAYRCTDESGLINHDLLEFEFKWWVTHYSNVIDIEALRAGQKGLVL